MNFINEENYALLIGKILANLQGLEFAIRAYLYAKLDPPHKDFPTIKNLYEYQIGEEVPENAMTCYDPLKVLIARYNKLAASEYKVDEKIVELRDAIAHGRVAATGSSNYFRLMKTERATKGVLTVSYSVEMTEDWLKEQIRRTRAESKKVTNNPHSIGA